MTDLNGYAVYFFPQALEALGEAIKPYLQDGPSGMHVICREIDTSGSLIEMTLDGTSSSAPEAEGGVAALRPDRKRYSRIHSFQRSSTASRFSTHQSMLRTNIFSR